MRTKTCKDCAIEKPLEQFYRAGKYHQPCCKPCQKTRDKRRYQKIGPEGRARIVAMVKANKYGFASPEALRDFAEAHGDLCDLCSEPDTTHRKRTWTRGLTMDHDPATGKFRGMLCSKCNLAIGHAEDDPELLRRMADYVERFR